MKRLRVILLFLLLGAIVNVAVAWGGFQLSEGTYISEGTYGIFYRSLPMGNNENALWSRHAADGWLDAPIGSPDRPMKYRRWYGLLAGGRYIGLDVFGSYLITPNMTNAEMRELYRGSGSFEVSQINSGFPLRSMRTEEWSGNPDTRFFTPTAGHDAFDFSGFRFPKHILWLGFIINTVFYAMLLRPLFAVPGRIRSKIRRKRGLCLKCAYDLRGAEHEACPECGLEVPLQ